jgi:hypothetical protein
MAETEARFLACFCSSFEVSVFAAFFWLCEEVKLPELRVLSISEPRETPLPLKAVNEDFFSSSG